MKHFIVTIAVFLLTGTIIGCNAMNPEIDIETEKAKIAEVIKNNIGWAVNKDTDLLYSTVAHDEDLFWFSPDDAGTVRGFKAFTELTENFFLLDDFKAISSNVRELEINLSKSGDAAWYRARLDDYNEWKGKPANWENVRWTGVLEKQKGNWVIVQMHFSYPYEQMVNKNTESGG